MGEEIKIYFKFLVNKNPTDNTKVIKVIKLEKLKKFPITVVELKKV